MEQLKMRAGCAVPFPEKLFESYTPGENRIFANVSADKLGDMMTGFIRMHEEPLFFILELPTNANDEHDLSEAQHNDVYYIDALDSKNAERILETAGELLYADGLAMFGFGCHESGDEIMSVKYNEIIVFSKEIEKYYSLFKTHDIPRTEKLVTAWDTFSYENPGKCFAVNINGKMVYDIPEMFKDWGIYLAERRND